MAVLNLFHIFATTVDSTAVEKNLLIMKFYNREKEIAELKRVQELAFGQNSRMIVVTGRRRIGKTSLIKQALKGTPTVYFFIGRKAESILVADFIKIVRETADESSWARGQAWALYGYTTCYRYTKDKKYLDQAQKVYNFIFNNKNLPEDLVPYWDYDAPNIPNEPRDASAAACTASALYELDGYLPGNHYKETADKIMESLGSPAYRAEVGTNGNFILMHSVGSIPHGQEIDVPLNYADYYFLEGLMRKRDLEKK